MKDELPHLAEGLEGFEVWDRDVRAPENREVGVAFVSVRASGVIGMNKAAHKMWAEPECCKVMFDPERKRIAFRPCVPTEPGSYEVSRSGVQIPCKMVFDYYDVQIFQTRRYYDPKVIDGVMVVDL